MQDCKHVAFHKDCAVCWWKVATDNEPPRNSPLSNNNWTKEQREDIGMRMALKIAENNLDKLREELTTKAIDANNEKYTTPLTPLEAEDMFEGVDKLEIESYDKPLG